jgi:hypothetical protein
MALIFRAAEHKKKEMAVDKKILCFFICNVRRNLLSHKHASVNLIEIFV